MHALSMSTSNVVVLVSTSQSSELSRSHVDGGTEAGLPSNKRPKAPCDCIGQSWIENMAPSYSRQLLTLTLPTFAIILSYLWFKRKRISSRSDPGDNSTEERSVQIEKQEEELEQEQQHQQIVAEEKVEDSSVSGSPPAVEKTFSRSLSSPIDIVLPQKLRSQKSNQMIISDEDLDKEICKVKSMKSNDPYSISKLSESPIRSPEKEEKVREEIRITPKKESVPKQSQTPKQSTPTTPKGNKKTPAQKSPKSEMSPAKNKSPVKGSPKKTAQREPAKVEEKKMVVKKVETTKSAVPPEASQPDSATKGKENENVQRRSCDRDSANHSPVDVILASPSPSSLSNHSEGSNDSGKGGSDVATPPSRTPAGDVLHIHILYEFAIPQTIVGKLIGVRGKSILDIKEKSGAELIIKRHLTDNKLKICSIEGTQPAINSALRMIRSRFPSKRYPELTLKDISHRTPDVPIKPDTLYLKLIPAVNNDTIVSYMVSPGHFFLHQPTHPSFPSLQVLRAYMTDSYNSSDEVPSLPEPITRNVVCVAKSGNEWHRVITMSSEEATNSTCVCYLDYGGYEIVENKMLKQIRADFMFLPFQAAECFLADIKPVGDDDWSIEAYDYVSQLIKGALIVTQIIDYSEEDIPLVHMYILLGPHMRIFLNDDLVTRGYAEYVNYQPMQEEAEAEGAVGGVLVA